MFSSSPLICELRLNWPFTKCPLFQLRTYVTKSLSALIVGFSSLPYQIILIWSTGQHNIEHGGCVRHAFPNTARALSCTVEFFRAYTSAPQSCFFFDLIHPRLDFLGWLRGRSADFPCTIWSSPPNFFATYLSYRPRAPSSYTAISSFANSITLCYCFKRTSSLSGVEARLGLAAPSPCGLWHFVVKPVRWVQHCGLE